MNRHGHGDSLGSRYTAPAFLPLAGHYYSTDEPAVDGVVSSFLAGCE
jgi:hypothetical protein